MSANVTAPGPPTPFATEFPYGWRYVTRTDGNGKEEVNQIPLTLEDVLHPLEGDVIPQNTLHCDECIYIQHACRTRLHGMAGVLVLNDCLIHWGDAGVRPMSPDVAVIFDVADPSRQRGTYYTAEEGTLPRVVVEIVSPNTRSNDVTKMDLYHRVGIPEYVMIDQLREDGPRTLRHFQWQPRGYREVPVSEDGVLLHDAHVRLRLRDGRIVCLDGRTGEEILHPDQAEVARAQAELKAQEEAQAREEAEREREQADRAREQADRAREQADLRAERQTRAREEADRAREQADHRAEQQTRAREQADFRTEQQTRAREEAERARKDAERRAEEQARARKEADRIAQEQAQARQEADRAREEADRARRDADRIAGEQIRAREDAERRARELEAELRRLRGEPPA